MPATGLSRRVVFIDAEPRGRPTLASRRRKAGHDGEAAESGRAGLASFRENPAPIVLADLR